MEKATLKDLIARKMQKEKDREKIFEIPVESLGKSLIFKNPSDELKLDLLDELGDKSSLKDVVKVYKKLIYLSCELLQDTELHAELEIKDPFDTVDAIFSLSDITEIGEQLMDSIDSPGEQIKNS